MWQPVQRDGELWTAVWWWHVPVVAEMAVGRGDQRDPVSVPLAERGYALSFPQGLLWFQGPVHVVGCHHASLSLFELSPHNVL